MHDLTKISYFHFSFVTATARRWLAIINTNNAQFKVPLFFLLQVLMNDLTSIQPMCETTIQQNSLQFNITMFIITSLRVQDCLVMKLWRITNLSRLISFSFQDGYRLLNMVLLTDVVILKAEVRPLYKTSNQPHQSWLLSTKEDPLLLVTAIA